MAFEILITQLALGHLKVIRAFDRRKIVEEINQQLPHQPTAVTRNRKLLKGATPDFEHEPPVWESRVGDFRVFYDVAAEARVVFVRAVLRKDAGQTTGDIIHERDDS